MKEIALTKGKFALVDDADYEWLMQWKWHARCRTYKGKQWWYASRRNPPTPDYPHGKYVHMHTAIANPDEGLIADHEDGDGLNNQRYNLRPCNQSQNLANRGPNRNNTSGFKGVWWAQRRWIAAITVNKKSIHLGRFVNPNDAAEAYDAAARLYFGSFAKTNF